nr:hypothetical protein GCM10020093_031220 [Planobispora longispora]
MSFSNNGVDTFDPGKGYIGIRLQQGVPLLDRDWNELEDIRRHFERELRRRTSARACPASTASGSPRPTPTTTWSSSPAA